MDIKEENKTKKEYLWGYQNSIKKVKRLEEELLELRLNKLSPSLIQDGMPHGSGGGDLSGYSAKKDKIEREIEEERIEGLRKLDEIRRNIEMLCDEDEKDVLVYRYIKNMKWESICEKTHYKEAQIHRIHANALKSIKIIKR